MTTAPYCGCWCPHWHGGVRDRRSGRILVVAGEGQSNTVARGEPAGVGNQRDSILDIFTGGTAVAVRQRSVGAPGGWSSRRRHADSPVASPP